MLEGESWVFFFSLKLIVANDFAVFLYLSSEMDGGEYFPEVPSPNIIDFVHFRFFFLSSWLKWNWEMKMDFMTFASLADNLIRTLVFHRVLIGSQ